MLIRGRESHVDDMPVAQNSLEREINPQRSAANSGPGRTGLACACGAVRSLKKPRVERKLSFSR